MVLGHAAPFAFGRVGGASASAPSPHALRVSSSLLFFPARLRAQPTHRSHNPLPSPCRLLSCAKQDVQRNLEPKNRDKFTQNLTIVRHEFRSKV